MRLAFAIAALLACLTLLPTASAREIAPELPFFVRPHVEATPPSADCPTCFDAAIGAGAGMSGCCDLPAFGALAEVSGDEEGIDGRVRVCYTSFLYHCYVDQPIHV